LIQFQETVYQVKIDNADKLISEQLFENGFFFEYAAFKTGMYLEDTDSTDIKKLIIVIC